MAGESWYVSNECVPINRLQPIWFLAVSIFFQTAKAWFIGIREEKQSNDEYYDDVYTDMDDIELQLVSDESSTNNAQSKKSSKFGCIKDCFKRIIKPFTVCKPLLKPLQIALKIWSIFSVLSITYVEIKEMVIWIDNHQFLNGWDHFMCMGCILFTSSSFKTTFPFLFNIISFCIKYSGNLSGGIRENILTSILWIVTMIHIIITLPWWILILWPSIVIVTWHVTLIVSLCGSIAFFMDYDIGKLNSSNWRNILWWFCFAIAAIFSIGFYGLWSSFALVTINIYSGINYWESFFLTFQERKTSIYWAYSMSNAKSKLKFLTWIF